MNRRALLGCGVGVAALALAGYTPGVMATDERFLLTDLEPDRLWPIYRRYRLLILGQHDDTVGSAVAEAIVDVLARSLPDSRARLARAADSRRVGVLIGTNQLDVAIMDAQGAEALFLARPPFEDIRNVPLRVIASFGSHVLVCREDFEVDHAYLLARTLAEHTDALPASIRAPQGVVPTHPGSRAFFAGEKMPAPARVVRL